MNVLTCELRLVVERRVCTQPSVKLQKQTAFSTVIRLMPAFGHGAKLNMVAERIG